MHQGLQRLEHHGIWPDTSSYHSFFTAKPQPTVIPSTHVSLKVNNTTNIHKYVANESICKNCQKYVLLFEGNTLFIRPVQYHISIACSIYYHTLPVKFTIVKL